MKWNDRAVISGGSQSTIHSGGHSPQEDVQLPPPPFRVAIVSSVIVWLFSASPHAASLTEAPRLTTVYDAILAARFDEVRTMLPRTCPPAPLEACAALTAASLWWQIQLNPNNRALDEQLEAASRAAFDAAGRWTDREPRRAEAWFYAAGSLAPLVLWRVLRGQRLSAAREGKTIKSALERALELDPTLEDAHFGIGLYHYYADVVPAGFKLIRWLFLLPGGDRRLGLSEMLQARQRGVLLRGEIDFQLHYLYLWYEHQPDRALELLRGLDEVYPSNPVFLQRIAEVQHEYMHDHEGSAATWERLLARERGGVTINPRRALAQLQLGAELEHAGQRDRAIAAYTAATALAPHDDVDDVRSRAREALKRVDQTRK